MRRYRKFPDFEIVGARHACLATCFSQKTLCALPVALLRPLMTINYAMYGLDIHIDLE